MLKFTRSHSDTTILVVILAALALGPFLTAIPGATGPSSAHHFVPTHVELPAVEAEPAPTF